MATKFSAHALEWWLRGQGKFDGAKVSTKEIVPGSGDFVITQWDANGVPQPGESEINQIIANYNAAEAQRKSAEVSSKSTVRAKLTAAGYTDAEIDLILGV